MYYNTVTAMNQPVNLQELDAQHAQRLLDVAAKILADPATNAPTKAQMLLVHSVMSRQHMLTGHLRAALGRHVQTGPLAGLAMFPDNFIEASTCSRLLGYYEYPLRPIFEQIVATQYDRIVNIGCAEGYYAVGLARIMPQTRVIAADIDATMRERCARLAALNNVSDRVEIIGELTHDNLQARIQPGERTLILCDIEGAEDELLDPAAVPALAQCDLLVELHEVYRPGLTGRLTERFATTHDYRQIETYEATPTLPAFANSLSELDRALLIFEGREGPTPWGWWTAKKTV